MNAHQLGAGGVILNTIVVDSLSVFPNLIDASVGGTAGDTWNGTAIVKKPIPPRDVAAEKAAFILQVKSEAGELTTQVLKGLESEYELAEKEAVAYKAAGYPATPIPGSVQSEINSKAAKGVTITATVAADTILAKAAGWRTAQAALRDNRLTTVSAAEVAVDGPALDVIKANRASFMASLKDGLGV